MHEPNPGKDLLTDLGYEATDVRLRPLVAALGVLIALILVSAFGILWFYDLTSPRYAQDMNKPRWETERKLPPHPQVQAHPKEEMELFYKAQEPALVAVEKAKEEMASRGIAGVTGGNSRSQFSDNYPGSGRFEGAGHGAADGAPAEGGHAMPASGETPPAEGAASETGH